MMTQTFTPDRITRYIILLPLIILCNLSASKADTFIQSGEAEPVAIARGKIDVSGGLITLSAIEGGVVSFNNAEPGKKVFTGQVLIQLEDLRINGEKRIAESELNLDQVKYENLKKLISAMQLKFRRLKLAAQLGAVQKQLSDDAGADLIQRQTELNLAAAEILVAREHLNAINERYSSLVVKAPYNGIVVTAHVQPGELVHPGEQVITLLPEKPLIVRAEVNESYIARLSLNMKARVRVDGQDSSEIEGKAHIERMSSLFTMSNLNNNGQHIPERTVECILRFDNPPEFRVGQRVIVDFYGSNN